MSRMMKIIRFRSRIEEATLKADEIKNAMEGFTQKVYAIFGKLYQQQGGEGQVPPENGPTAGSTNPDGTVNTEGDVR